MIREHFNDFVLWFLLWLLWLVGEYAAESDAAERQVISERIDTALRRGAGNAYDAGQAVDIGNVPDVIGISPGEDPSAASGTDTLTSPDTMPVASDVARKAVASFVETQISAIAALLSDLPTLADDDIERRCGYYANALWSRYWDGVVDNAASQENLIAWRLGDTEAHCATCLGMSDGSPWSPYEFKRRNIHPQSYECDCHGFNCHCYLEVVSAAEAVGAKTMPIPTSAAPRSVIKTFAVKEAKADGNKLACYPSVMGNLDSYADVIFPPKKAGKPGPFAKALPGFMKRGFNPLDHKWEWSEVVGYPVLAEERGNKLYSEMEFHSDQKSQDALTKARERLAANKDVGLSIGFSMMPGQYLYFSSGRELLDYAKAGGWDLALFDVDTIRAWDAPCSGILEIEELFEYSLTPTPANLQAIGIAIKRAADRGRQVELSASRSHTTTLGDIRMTNMKNRLKTICGARNLPLVSAKWTPKDALSRIKELTGASTEPNAEYAKAFVVVDGPNEEFASYKYPFADVVNGKLSANFNAVKAVAHSLQGDTASAELTASAIESAKRFVEAYYAKMSAETGDEIAVPWAGEKSDLRWKGQYLGQYIEVDMCMSAMYEGFYSLYYELGDCLAGYGDYSDMSASERMACISGMFDEYKSLCLGICQSIAAGDSAEDTEMAVKSARQILISQLGNLGDGLPYSKQAALVVDASKSLIERTAQRHAMRQKSNRDLSTADLSNLREFSTNVEELDKSLKSLIEETKPKGTDAHVRDERLRKARLKTLSFQLEAMSGK